MKIINSKIEEAIYRTYKHRMDNKIIDEYINNPCGHKNKLAMENLKTWIFKVLKEIVEEKYPFLTVVRPDNPPSEPDLWRTTCECEKEDDPKAWQVVEEIPSYWIISKSLPVPGSEFNVQVVAVVIDEANADEVKLYGLSKYLETLLYDISRDENSAYSRLIKKYNNKEKKD
nr:hypothetical protein K-LCC10_0270 [Kaumoebavirus]